MDIGPCNTWGSEGNSGRFFYVPFHTAYYKGYQTSLYVMFETVYDLTC